MGAQTPDEIMQEQPVSKAAIVSGSFAFGLGYQQASQFIDYIVDESAAFQQARVVKMAAPVFDIPKINFSGDIMRPAVAATDPGDTVGLPTATRIRLTSQELIVATLLDDSALEDQVEGQAFMNHFMKIIASKVANELEFAALHGHLWGGVVFAPQHIRSLFTGWVTQSLAAGHVVDANVAFSDRYQSLTVGNNKLTSAIKAMPTKYRQNQAKMRFFVHPDLVEDYIAQQTTVYGMGPQSVTGDGSTTYRSVPVVPTALMQGNAIVAATYAGGSTTLTTDVVARTSALTVAGITSFANADTITVGVGTAQQEVAVVSGTPAGSTINLVTPLLYDHASGDAVQEYTAITNDGAYILYTRPENLILGIQRDIRFETIRVPRKRATDIVMTIRMDVKTENDDATVVIKNMKVRA